MNAATSLRDMRIFRVSPLALATRSPKREHRSARRLHQNIVEVGGLQHRFLALLVGHEFPHEKLIQDLNVIDILSRVSPTP